MVSQIDRDGDGLLDQEEVMAYQIRLTEHNTKKLTGKVFEKNDDNSDGKVSFQEMWSESEEGVSLDLYVMGFMESHDHQVV